MTDGNETIKRGTTTTPSAGSGTSRDRPPPLTTMLVDSGNAAQSLDASSASTTSQPGSANTGVMSRLMGSRNRTKSHAPSSHSSSSTSSAGSSPHRPPLPSPMSEHPPSTSGSDSDTSYSTLSAFGTLTATITRTFARSPQKSSATGTTSPRSQASSSGASTVMGGTTLDPDDASRRTSITSSSTLLRRQQQLEAEEEANRGVTLTYRFKNLTVCPTTEWNATDNITTIMLSNNCLTAIPEELCSLPFLRTLSLSTNQIATINPNIVNLVTLQTLNLSANQLTTSAVDEVDWSQMGSLRALYLVRNKLTSFPKSVIDTEIETLSLSDNLIDTIPPEINTMAHLQWIGLSNNKISSLDPLFTLHQLSGVTIAGNPITETDQLKRRLRHLTRTMRLSGPETSESPLEFMARARTMTQQLERQLVRELARHSIMSPQGVGGSPNSPLIVAGSPFNVFRPATPPEHASSPGTLSGSAASPSGGKFSAASRTTFAVGKTARGGTLRNSGSGSGSGSGVFGGVGVSRMAKEMSLERTSKSVTSSIKSHDSSSSIAGTPDSAAHLVKHGSPLSATAMMMNPGGTASESAVSQPPHQVVHEANAGDKFSRNPSMAASGVSGESEASTIRRNER